MRTQFFQPNIRENLYDAEKDAQFSGVLFFQLASKLLDQAIIQEKVLATDKDVATYINRNESAKQINIDNRSLFDKFIFSVDYFVINLLKYLSKISYLIIKVIVETVIEFFVQLIDLINEVYSYIKKISLKKKPKAVLYYGVKKNIKFKNVEQNIDEIKSFFANNYAVFLNSINKKSSVNLLQKYRLTFAVISLGISFVSIFLLIAPLFLPQLLGIISFARVKPSPTPTPLIYNSFYTPEQDSLYPITDFRLVVPKINLESNIVDNVDPNIEGEYKDKLQFGVAHAKGSYLPPETGGPVYLFAHSTDSIINIARFNAKFYSVRELEAGDEIKVFFNNKEYVYHVTEKFVINPEEVDIVQNAKTDLILQTCWPPGTDWQRLIVLANSKECQNI